jgi:hypothetical protein
MPEREYEITVGADGLVELHIKGHKGKRCHDIAAMFEKIVGEIKSSRNTTEFFEPEEQVQYRIDQRQ